MSRKKHPKKIDKAIIVALITLVGTIVTALLTYLATVSKGQTDVAQTTDVSHETVLSTAAKNISVDNVATATDLSNCPQKRTSKIKSESIYGTAWIDNLNGNCSLVSERETIDVSWMDLEVDRYFLWVFIYSPNIQQYFPHACGPSPLSSDGTIKCGVAFSSPESYEIVIVLVNSEANKELKKQQIFSEASLPSGIDEKDSLSVYRSP